MSTTVDVLRAARETVLADIVVERRRQVEVEGWTPEHDDAHSDGALAKAATCYSSVYPLASCYWPGDLKWWKPKDRRSNLVKAGALIVAEIERLDRAIAAKDTPSAQPAYTTINDHARKILLEVLTWAEQRCPCKDEQPNPCPLCDADAYKPGDVCLSAERTMPRRLLERIRHAIADEEARAKEKNS